MQLSLNELNNVIDQLKNKSRHDNTYWKREETLVRERILERQKEEKIIRMSPEKYHQAFSL